MGIDNSLLGTAPGSDLAVEESCEVVSKKVVIEVDWPNVLSPLFYHPFGFWSAEDLNPIGLLVSES